MTSFLLEKLSALCIAVAVMLSIRELFKVWAIMKLGDAIDHLEASHGRLFGNDLRCAINALRNAPREYNEGAIGLEELRSRLIACRDLESRFALLKPACDAFAWWYFLTKQFRWLRR